jgi:peptide deformylase
MTIRKIHILPDPVLRERAAEIIDADEKVKALAQDMIDTMYAAAGIGLAGPQIGVLQRIVVMDLAREDEDPQPVVLLNPEITEESDELSSYEEGCLSIPDYYEEVTRPAKIKFRYMDLDGNTHERDADGLLATCVQHEIDHLNGVLFIDYLSKLKREMVVRKFTKNARKHGGEPIMPEPRPRRKREGDAPEGDA